MTVDEKALQEAERWFREKLRGTTALLEYEYGLFAAMAEREYARGEFHVPKERHESPFVDPFADMTPATLPPPNSCAQRDLIQMSKATVPPKR